MDDVFTSLRQCLLEAYPELIDRQEIIDRMMGLRVPVLKILRKLSMLKTFKRGVVVSSLSSIASMFQVAVKPVADVKFNILTDKTIKHSGLYRVTNDSIIINLVIEEMFRAAFHDGSWHGYLQDVATIIVHELTHRWQASRNSNKTLRFFKDEQWVEDPQEIVAIAQEIAADLMPYADDFAGRRMLDLSSLRMLSPNFVNFYDFIEELDDRRRTRIMKRLLKSVASITGLK